MLYELNDPMHYMVGQIYPPFGRVVAVRSWRECDGTINTRPCVEFEDGKVYYPAFRAWDKNYNPGVLYMAYWSE